jgi:hypothetical protein
MTEIPVGSVAPPTSRFSRPRITCLMLSLLVVLVCVGLGYWVFGPNYEVVPIPSPSPYGWNYSERSVQTWDDGSRYYLWRVETEVIGCSCDHDGLVEYFDNWFTTHDWVKIDPDNPPTCGATFPEANFFEPNRDNGYIIYRQKSHQLPYTGPQACLAIWGDPGFLHIVLQTENPSFWTSIIAQM